MQPSPQTTSPAGWRGSAMKHAPGNVRQHSSRPSVQTSTRPRRCPWFADVQRLAAEPARCYSAWRGVAILHAGSGAWERAAETRDAGRRACTVLPPGADPAAIVWPAVRQWIADVADLEPGAAIELGRCLIDHGAAFVVMAGDRLRGGLTLRRAGNA